MSQFPQSLLVRCFYNDDLILTIFKFLFFFDFLLFDVILIKTDDQTVMQKAN